MFEDLWIIDKSFRKYLDYFLEDKKVVWNGKFQFLTTASLHFPLYSRFKVAYYSFFPITASLTRALSKPRKISYAYVQNSRERDKENPEIKQYEKLPKKNSSFILGFLKR